MKYEAIVIGVSAGGMNAMKTILPSLPAGYGIPLILVQHIGPRSDGTWIRVLRDFSRIKIKEAEEKEKIGPGTVYVAPPNYHLLIEKDKTVSLSTSERVNFSRPSIDVLFESASDAYGDGLIGIVLTGANSDGAKGLKKIKENGGLAIVQDPLYSEVSLMPESAIRAGPVDYILSLEKIAELLIRLD
ncbi:chemotaxis protein CheB [Leptospira borgpetersenii]|uniref:chemotaxis protein CheB n=1 Tax=Leptospira borgpetersenii TaxID=174 RepID=UPI000773C8D2|nr:chemotaxis protein CheB [Leptospira borgpetersenii]MBE8398656.1 chemotaxis protein CheB [Leptospira borgpetersenii serovar Tarassovi]MBE8401722.1 chemotaxis protein CheB [Leptospira borgpetersenii serovar Tarassovi]MBE8404817.1 chemotaxis protein CheB [Leptospira borgpetersenii serovar Tarassovi]MBE8411115.1 chemotaxis protein CheB [Leptospira borgpetersenii serovar Tarassovi]MBE8414214.1 chemotaxis protein CheB [Leptospira borgpetersenii serovar Tarassovi]